MGQSNNQNPLLDLLVQPAFLVQDSIIVQVNRAAQQKLISAGDSIEDLLGASLPVYQEFNGGCLYTTVQLKNGACGATITLTDGMHLFCLEESNQTEQVLSLVAQQLRAPLHSLFSAAESQPKSEAIHHGLYQLHRIVANMSDYPRYQEQKDAKLEPTDICRVFAETVEKAASLVEAAGIHLNYTALPQYAIGMADREMLERAAYNLISNAVKFSPKGNSLDIKLTANGNILRFSVQDQGDGISPEVLSTIFSRYLRTPGIEDSRHGVGLGLALVRTAAVNHCGTVLIDQPEGGGTRVTMTVTVNPTEDTVLRSPIRLPQNDYAGGHDHGLLELSDVLPKESYKE